MDAFQETYAYRRASLPPMVRRLLIITTSAFVAQILLDVATAGRWTALLALSIPGLRRGMLWQPLTYLFVHGNFMHLAMNMLGLYFLGPETERLLGSRDFLRLYLLSGVIGGLGWVLTGSTGLCLGASGSVFGVLGAFVSLRPNRRLFLIFFPVPIKAWVLAVGITAIQFISMLAVEQAGIAYGVHLVGIAAGYILAKLRNRKRYRAFRSRPPSDADTALEIDRLLEKISREGIHRLTPAERRRLEEASRRRRRRR